MKRSFADLLLITPTITNSRVSCSVSDFNSYLQSLPMASPFNPISNPERTILAFSSGTSFAAGAGISAPLISQLIQYASRSTTCFPACVLISYSLSVGVGSVASSKVGLNLHSYFLESYRQKWQEENAGKYFVEKGILKQVPQILKDNPLPPEGLAFVTSFRCKSGLYELISRIIIVNSLVYIVGFLVRKAKKIILGLTKSKKSLKMEQSESFTEVDSGLDGLEIYHRIVGEGL